MKRKSEASFSESRPYAAQHPGEAPMYRWVGPSASGTSAPHPTHAFRPGFSFTRPSPLGPDVPVPQDTPLQNALDWMVPSVACATMVNSTLPPVQSKSHAYQIVTAKVPKMSPRMSFG